MIAERFVIGRELNPDMKVYRYMSLKQFMHFIENNKTCLTRVSSWEDTWEAPTMKLPTLNEIGKLSMPLYSDEMDLFAQCWTSKKESDAMWRIYSPYKDGIKIRTTVKKFELLQEVNYYAIEKVFYYKDLIQGLNYCSNNNTLPETILKGLIKREEFEHEQEIRLITHNSPRAFKRLLKPNENYLELGLNAKDFIEEIVIDPRAEEYYVKTIKAYCERVGINVIPEKSNLYNDDIFEQTRLAGKWVPVR